MLDSLAAYTRPGKLRQLPSMLRTAVAMLKPGETRIDWAHLPDDLVDELQRGATRTPPTGNTASAVTRCTAS